MKRPDIPDNEKQRLEALYAYQLLDEIEQQEFNEIVNLAAQICQTPISLITLIDSNTQWHKARVGLDVKKISREVSFCGHAINEPDEIFIVKDASKDERFADNPLVTGDPNIAFYAGIPLITHDGYALGALCVIDRKPRQLEDSQITALQTLSKQVIRLFELRKLVKESDEKDAELNVKNEKLDEICHDLKSYLRKMEISAEVLKRKHENELDEESIGLLNSIQQEALDSIKMINNKII